MENNLTLRKVTEEDTEFILGLRNDPNILKYFKSNDPITEEQHLNFIKKIKNEFYWIIEYDYIAVGTISIYNIEYTKAEWGRILIDPKYKRMGLGKRALLKVIDYAFNELNLTQLYCGVIEYNTPAIELYKKVGFMIDEDNIDFIEKDDIKYKYYKMIIDRG